MQRKVSLGAKVMTLWGRFRNFALLVGGLGLVALVWHYWFSIRVTFDLEYPANPQVLILTEEQEVIVTRGVLDEKYGRILGSGEYREVLTNKHGSFYLAPARGYLVGGGRSPGLGVGGIYVSRENADEVYLWDYLLKNENRNLENPSTSRRLSMTGDQPERAMFLDPRWYEEKSWSFLGRPMIDDGFVLSRSLFLGEGRN